MDQAEKELWGYLAPADRETLISAILAWLFDPTANHGLGSSVLDRVLQLAGHPAVGEGARISTEVREGRDRRFDIVVNEGEAPLVFEVKCKTHGSAEQLERYSRRADVVRIAFDEWNYPNLTDRDRERFPLIRFDQIAGIVRKASVERSWAEFTTSFANHLRQESDYFSQLKAFFIDETTDSLLDRPTSAWLSQRFYNQLFWHWFRERLAREEDFVDEQTYSESQLSGVWFITLGNTVGPGETKGWPSLGLQLDGRFDYWCHAELYDGAGITAVTEGPVGRIKLNVDGVMPPERSAELYRSIRSAEATIEAAGFRVPKRAPRATGTFMAVVRELDRDDFRYTRLVQLLKMLA